MKINQVLELPNGETALLTSRILFLASIKYKDTHYVYIINNEQVTIDGMKVDIPTNIKEMV